jgi:hypothetical protein
MHALWAAVLRQVIVIDRDLDYLDSEDFLYICGTMALDPAWVSKKLRQAIADKAPRLHQDQRKASLRRDEAATILEEPASNPRPRARRTHSEATRAKIKAAWAKHREDPVAYAATRAAISQGQVRHLAAKRGEAA